MPPITKDDLDWLRSPEATIRGVTAAEIKVYEEIWRRKVKLESKIKSAFADCTLGDGIGLREADGYGLRFNREESIQARNSDERECWENISQDDLFECQSAVYGTDALGYRFLIPAFMLSDLESSNEELVVIHLSLKRDDLRGTCSQLNCDQLEAIIDFLELFLSDPDSRFHHDSIGKALELFWRPLLKQRSQAEQEGGADLCPSGT